MSLFGSESVSSQRTWTVLRPVDPEVLQRMLLYASKTAYYLLGYYGDETRCRLLTFPKQAQTNDHRLEVVEDPRTYTPSEAQEYFQRIDSDPNEEGLTLLCEAFGILGCFRFLEGYYLFLITKRKCLGSLAGHKVYGISDTALIPLSGCHDGWAERRYRKLLLSGVDLTKDFFFSYTYNISYTVQHNLTHEEHLDPFDCIFVWNAYLTRDLRTALSDTKWVLPLVHGSWQQRNLSIFGKIVHLTLISRRSRRFAGTRYLKRGINQLGWVANEVETEQIVSLQNLNQSGVPSLASINQIRGSIPLFWGQATSALNPRPSIQLYNMDPLYEATRKHFDDLFERYGDRVVVLNLVKSQERQPRETILRKAFGRAVSFLNDHVYTDDREIVYHPWDFKAHMKKDARRFFKDTEPLMQDCVRKTGFCCMHPNPGRPGDSPLQLQQGVMRSNCIDCLDRTNITQYFYGLVGLGSQLCSLGLLSTNEIDPDCSFAYQLMQMYEIMGNDLALQYGGSEAHGTFFERMRGNSEAATQSRELLRTIKRCYNNAVSDPEKQDAINLFLGHFIPNKNEANIWELDSDYFLHCGVDYEKRHSNFGIRPSLSLSPHPSVNETGAPKHAHKASALEFFPVPVVSRAGGPEALPTEQTVKKDASSSSWLLASWLRPNKEEGSFRLPDARGPVLDRFEEMLAINPVVDVRLHDEDVQRKLKKDQRPAFQKTIARLLTQEALTEKETGTALTGENRSESCAGCPSLSSDSAVKIRSDAMRHHRRHRKPTTQSDRPVKQDPTSDPGDGSFPRASAKSELRSPDLRRRSWFCGLARRSVESRDKRSNTVALRTLSTPTDVTRAGMQGSLGRADPVEDFWDEYWSITEQSLTNELTLAERVSMTKDKRETIRQARANNSFVPKHTVGKMTAANVFLDELLDQCLDAKSPVRCIPDQETRETRADGDASMQETMGVRSNINELLFTSAKGPGDRVLEKWYLADQKAKADYHRNLMWIISPVDLTSFGPIQA